jgi:hypothetical protein
LTQKGDGCIIAAAFNGQNNFVHKTKVQSEDF